MRFSWYLYLFALKSEKLMEEILISITWPEAASSKKEILLWFLRSQVFSPSQKAISLNDSFGSSVIIPLGSTSKSKKLRISSEFIKLLTLIGCKELFNV